MGYQKPYVKEGQTMQWVKDKGKNTIKKTKH